MPRPKKEQPNRKDGLYEVKITIGKNSDGSLVRKSFYSSVSKEDARKQAEQFKIEQQVAQRSGSGFVAHETTFEAWANKWLLVYKKGNCKEHTYHYTYRVNVEKYMIPFFGTTKLKDITQADIQRYFNEHNYLAETNLKRHKNILHDIFEQAIYNDLCYKNPVRKIKYVSTKDKRQKCAYTLEQANLAMNYAKNHKKGLGAYIMLNTGMRRGEVLGLMWKDIDFTQKTVSVQRAIEPDTRGMPQDGELKSQTSYRTIPVSDNFINYLSSLERKSDFVLAGNTEWGYMSIYGFDKQFKNFMTAMSSETALPYLTPHELRHTFGTILRERGVDLYTISRVLGHSDSSITEKVYVHNDIEVLRRQLFL